MLIITFREDRPATEAYLREAGVVYSELITSTLQSCLEHGVDGWKAAVCRDRGVEILFDDDPKVVKCMDEATLCMIPVRMRHPQPVHN